MAAHKLAKEKEWHQPHDNGTSRRQQIIHNLCIGVRNEDGVVIPKLLSMLIHPKDETSKTVCDALFSKVEQLGMMLNKWRAKHESMFPGDKHGIPDWNELTLTKLSNAGVITTVTCNTARKTTTNVIHEIQNRNAQDNNEDNADAVTAKPIRQDCMNHLQNVWFEHVNKVFEYIPF